MNAFLGDDVSTLSGDYISGIQNQYGGNWERNQLAQIALADSGTIVNKHFVVYTPSPVRIVTPLNTVWSAVEWLTANGFYPNGSHYHHGEIGQWFTNAATECCGAATLTSVVVDACAVYNYGTPEESMETFTYTKVYDASGNPVSPMPINLSPTDAFPVPAPDYFPNPGTPIDWYTTAVDASGAVFVPPTSLRPGVCPVGVVPAPEEPGSVVPAPEEPVSVVPAPEEPGSVVGGGSEETSKGKWIFHR